MANYNFQIPYVWIREIRSAHTDSLFASAALKITNPNGALHRDLGGPQSVALGDRGRGSTLDTGIVWENIDVPDPTEDLPDGGAAYWTFTLINAGGADSGFIPVLDNFANAFAGALAGKVLDAEEAGNAGTAITAFLQEAELTALQEVLHLFTANCDGVVASGVFAFTAKQLAEMTRGDGIWRITQNNPGTNSPAGCGANSNYDIGYRISSSDTRLPWSGEDELGALTLYSSPVAVSWGLNRLDCFYLGYNNNMWHRSWNGNGWTGADDRGGDLASEPAAASWGPNRIDCFCRGQNDHMYHMWYDGGWHDWEDRGGVLTSAPAAVSWGENRIDCFYRGANNSLWHLWWDGNHWRGPEDLGGFINLGGNLTSAPAVASWGANRLDCFYRGANNSLWHLWYDGNRWQGAEDLGRLNLGGNLTSPPAAASWGRNRIDVFYRGQNNHLWHLWYDGKWNNAEDLGGTLTSAPAVASWGPYRLDCFYRGENDHLWHRWFTGWPAA